MQYKKIIMALIIFFACSLADPQATQFAYAQQSKPVDIIGLIKELMNFDAKDHQQTFAIWFPTELMQADEEDKKDYAYLNKYIVIVMGQQLEEDDGTKIYAKKSDLLKRISLKLGNGGEFRLAESIPPKVSDLAEYMKRSFARDGGVIKNAHIFIFSSTTDGWKSYLDTKNKNTLILSVKEGNGYGKGQLVWKTPFEATNPIAPCSKCREPLSPKWSYCPWCGGKIQQSKSRE